MKLSLHNSEGEDLYLGSLSMLAPEKPGSVIENDVFIDNCAITCCNKKFRTKMKTILEYSFMLSSGSIRPSSTSSCSTALHQGNSHLLTAVLFAISVVSFSCLSYPSFTSLLTMDVTMGTCGGIFVAIHPLYLLEIFPKETFTMAFGFAVGIHSISEFILHTISGELEGNT